MTGWYIAKEAAAIGDQIDFMNGVDDGDLPTYYEDILARVEFLGFRFRDVVQAGLYRLGRVSAHTVRIQEYCPEYSSIVKVDDWREQVRTALNLHYDRLRWTDSTFLRKMLVQGNISARELSQVDSIITGLIDRLHAEEWADGEESDSPLPNPKTTFPGDQLDLDI